MVRTKDTPDGLATRLLACFSLPTLCLLTLWAGLTTTAGAGLKQFDVFLGYDGMVREANWFPVACEIHNDGPGFNAVFELTNDRGAGGQVRQVVLELPSNTHKRFVIPVFASGGRYGTWTARLLDERGKVRDEKTNLRAKGDVAADSLLLGALARTFAGLPTFPEVRGKQQRPELQPAVARMDVAYFPDTPIALEGLDAIYLSSEKAPDLKVNQVSALVAWLHGGGHLILGVEQPSDINGTPWLRALLPCEFNGVSQVRMDGEFEQWLENGRLGKPAPAADNPVNKAGNTRRNPVPAPAGVSVPGITPDRDFDQADIPVVTGTLRDGRAVVTVKQVPLVIEAERGRGKITVLAFSPERKPFQTWKNRPWFWAHTVNLAPALFESSDFNRGTGWSIDGVFGAMIDSKQVRKLPVSWLLLLLVVYLLVIGPIDQYWLKKIGRQMLTWVTFPTYVVLFSLLIYWIGFMLRAGETEWNELHVVDVLPRGERAELRGHTYASVYSPANVRYRLASDQGTTFATLRGEFQGAWNGGQDSSRATIQQRGDGFTADIFVPVWTSQLYVNDWWQPSAPPFTAKVARVGNEYRVSVDNKLNRSLKSLKLAVNGRIYDLGEVGGGKTSTTNLNFSTGLLLRDFVTQQGSDFQNVIGRRRQALGDDRLGRLEASAAHVMAASFAEYLNRNLGNANNYQSRWELPARLDLTSLVERGDAVVLAWDAGNSFLAKPINQFSPRRSSRDTLLRLAVPVTNN
jgi:hypothetical protein